MPHAWNQNPANCMRPWIPRCPEPRGRRLLWMLPKWASVAKCKHRTCHRCGQPLARQVQIKVTCVSAISASLVYQWRRLSSHLHTPSNSVTGTLPVTLSSTHVRSSQQVDCMQAMLHEVGHVLGIGHSNNTASPMFPVVREPAALTTSDVASLRSLYGFEVSIQRGATATTTSRKRLHRFFSQFERLPRCNALVAYSDIGYSIGFRLL